MEGEMMGPWGTRRLDAVFAALFLSGSMTACGMAPREPSTTAALGTVPPRAGVAVWRTPPLLDTLLEAARVRKQSSVLVYVPQTGYVTGEPDVIATIGKPLPAVAGRNRTVEPCRDAVFTEASKLGALDVEAVSAGHEKRDRRGRIFAPVDMRITYKVNGGYELRRATLVCILDRKGRIADAYPIDPPEPQPQVTPTRTRADTRSGAPLSG
jgi:hypothetical protein